MTLSVTKRSAFLDLYRGTAVLLMMIFHLCWDLRHFGFIEYSIHDPFWVYFRSLIVTLFLTAIGWSSYITLSKSPSASFFWRDFKLFLAAVAISITTYFATPEQWIYFGILHFIFMASILCRPLVTLPVLSAFLGAIILQVYHFTDLLHFPNAFHIISQYIALPTKTLDIIFPFPWIGVVLLGPLLGFLNWHKVPTPNHFIFSAIAFMGRYALLIYLTHQIVFFALVAGIKTVLTSFF